MKILARGEKIKTDELKQKLSAISIDWTVLDTQNYGTVNLQNFDIIFDLNFDDHSTALAAFAPLKDKPVFVSAAKKSLAQAAHQCGYKIDCVLIGINALPTFINRSLAEVSLLDTFHSDVLKSILAQLGWEYKLVADRVGFITPRIILMIINEACYTVQEGTATLRDIDISMKLGTNYPYGPFEWADNIGVKEVYETLEAIYQDTHDERYKICPLLKTLYLKNGSFYN